MDEITERMIFDEAVWSIISTKSSELTQIIDDVEDNLLPSGRDIDLTWYKDTQTFIAETIVEYEDQINRVASQMTEVIEWNLALAWSIIQVCRGENK